MAFLKEKARLFLGNILWYYIFFSILFKSIILVGFIANDNHARISLEKAYQAIPSLLIYCCFIIILLSFSYLLQGKFRVWYLVLANLVFSFLLMSDLWYFRGFGTFISLHLLKQTANLDNLSGSIFSMARSIDTVFIFDAVILLIFTIFNKVPHKRMERNIILFLLLVIVSTGYISYIHYKVDIVENGSNQILFRICWTPNETIANLSPVGYHIYDTYKYLEERQPLVLKPEENEEIKAWYDQKIETLPDNEYKALFSGKNLLVLQVESLENFVINRKIAGQEITPNLNKLLKNSLYFSNFHEQVNEGTSSDADFLVNTSLYPLQRGSTFFRYPDNTYNSLPKLLHTLGYSSLAIYPVKGAFWNWTEAMKSIGFEKTMDISNFNMEEVIGLGISDGSYLNQIQPLAAKQPQPFHMHIVTLTSHGPFDIPEKYRELNLDKKLDQTKLGGYFQSIRYTDRQIGEFISGLSRDGLLDNTVVVIYGDHCGVHKYYQDELYSIQPTEDWWLEENSRIPLIIYQNKLNGEEFKTNGGPIDILPTISYLLGVDENTYIHTAMGRNLLKTAKDFAVITEKRKYVGPDVNNDVKENDMKGLDISDKIIRSNYFKNYKEDR